jgi:hypothetical protein
MAICPVVTSLVVFDSMPIALDALYAVVVAVLFMD